MMFASPHHGFFIAAAVMSIVGVIGFAICYLNCREHVPVKRNTANEQKAKASDYVKLVFTNKPLLCIILMTLFTISAMNTNNQMMIFFCQYNLGYMGFQPIVNGIMMGCSVVGILLIPKLVKKFGKKKTAIGGLLIGCAADLLNFVIPTNIYSFIVLVTIGYVAWLSLTVLPGPSFLTLSTTVNGTTVSVKKASPMLLSTSPVKSHRPWPLS